MGVEGDGLFKHFAAALQVWLGQAGQVLPPAEVVFVCSGAGLRAKHRLFFELAKNVAAQGSSHTFSDFVLNGEDVVKLAIEAAGPAMKAGCDFDQLDGDAEAIVHFSDTAFEQSADAQLLTYGANIGAGRTKLKRSGARSDAQAVHLG